MASEKTKKSIYWVLTGLVSFVFLGSAIGKFTANEEALKMAANFGLDARTYTLIGVVELVCLILFIIPRTGIIGTLLLGGSNCNAPRARRINYCTLYNSNFFVFSCILSIS